MRVLIINDKPPKDVAPGTFFKHPNAEKRLLRWLEILGVKDFDLIRRTDKLFSPLAQTAESRSWPILALGYDAAVSLRALGLYNFYHLPHPAGRNRMLSDRDLIDRELRLAKYYINSLDARRLHLTDTY